MRKILSDASALTHEEPIPTPFYSITRSDPVPEPSRDLSGTLPRYYKAQQILCNTCDEYIPLIDLENGVCSICGATLVTEDEDYTFVTYDLSSKSNTEVEEDEWHYVGAYDLPAPFTIEYQLDLWTDTKGERDYQRMLFLEQFHRNGMKGEKYIDVDYPTPVGTIRNRFDDPQTQDNSDLEPGEDSVDYRITFTFTGHIWLPPRKKLINVAKQLSVEYYDWDEELMTEEDDVFDNED